jgi:hypothetical protein
MHRTNKPRLGTPEEPSDVIARRLLTLLWNRLQERGEVSFRHLAEQAFTWQGDWHLFKPLRVDEHGVWQGPELHKPSDYEASRDEAVPPPYRIVRTEEDYYRVVGDYKTLRTAMTEGGYEAFKREWLDLMGPLPEGADEESEEDDHGR